MQVQNALGEAESEDAYILVEAVDIFGMIERHLETKRMTLKSLFMQFLRSQVSWLPLHFCCNFVAAADADCYRQSSNNMAYLMLVMSMACQLQHPPVAFDPQGDPTKGRVPMRRSCACKIMRTA